MEVKQLLDHLKSVPGSKTISVDVVSDNKRREYWVEKVETNEALIIIEYWEPKENQQMTVQQLLQELKQVDLCAEIKMINPFGEELCVTGFKDNGGNFITIYADYLTQ